MLNEHAHADVLALPFTAGMLATVQSIEGSAKPIPQAIDVEPTLSQVASKYFLPLDDVVSATMVLLSTDHVAVIICTEPWNMCVMNTG